MGIDPKIKDSGMAVKMLLNMGQRVSEQTKSKNITVIGWDTDRRNQKVYRLFDKFLAFKPNKNSVEVNFYVNVSDFDNALSKYM